MPIYGFRKRLIHPAAVLPGPLVPHHYYLCSAYGLEATGAVDGSGMDKPLPEFKKLDRGLLPESTAQLTGSMQRYGRLGRNRRLGCGG